MASNVCSLHEHDRIHGSSKLHVTILASEWGSHEGGLSTLNRELAIQLAKFSCIEVTFFLPKCSNEDKKAAASYGIFILEAERRPGYHDELDWLSFPPQHLKIDVVIGHGVKLGHQAQVIRDSHKCKWVQVVHTDPEELGMFKCNENPISTGEEKHNVEKELCQRADFVVGVGPKLAEAFRKYLGFCKKHQDVFEFTPGIFDDFLSVQQILNKRKQCSVLVFGRGDAEDFKVKGFDIAARSVAALSDTVLVFVGAPYGKHVEIAKRFVDFGVPEKRLKVKSYMNSREDLKQLFCEVDLVLMPSRTEGFGLTGLECLSAGLPVIVSKNTGFGEALGSVRFGSFFVIDSEDSSKWAAAIKEIWNKDRKLRLDEVEALRSSYGERYSWSEQCKDLIEKMKLLFGTRPSAFVETEDQHSLRKYGESYVELLISTKNLEKGKEEAMKKILSQTVQNYMKYNDHSRDHLVKALKSFTDHLIDSYGVNLVTVAEGSVIMIVECPSLESLELLWRDYLAGHLDKAAARFLVTDEIKKELNLETVCLKVKIEEENYLNCKEALMGLPKTCLGLSPRVQPKGKRGFEKNETSQPAESYVKLLLSTKDLEKEKEDAVEKCLSETVQNYAKFDDHPRDIKTKALKSSADHITNTYDVNLVTAAEGSIIVVVECPTLDSLELLWRDYLAGHLDKIAERFLVPDEVKKELNLEKMCLKATIEEKSYLNCKKALMKIPRTHSDDLTPEARPRCSSGTSLGNVIPMEAIKSPLNQLTLMAQMAIKNGDFPGALHFLSLGLAHLTEVASPFDSVPLLVQRAECFWQVGQFQASVLDMEQAIRAGLPRKFNNSQEEIWKWTDRGFSLYQNSAYHLAEKCVNLAFHFRDDPLAQTFLCRALVRYELNYESEAREDIAVLKRLDPRLAEKAAFTEKEKAFEEFKQRNYEKSLRLFRLALLLHPQSNSRWMKFKRSVESHQADASFKLQRYNQALEIGEQSYQSNSTVNVDEAKRWKDRGNKLSTDSSSVDMAIRCYSLALKCAPPKEKELVAITLSNRCSMYIKKGDNVAALVDARQCVRYKPDWAKAHYRLGSCLLTSQRLSEARQSFSRSLQLLLEDTTTVEHRKEDTFDQLLSVVAESGDTTSIQFEIPQNLTQKMIDKAVINKDWNRLYVLFMGGGGEKRFKKGSGGLGTGCDARNIPLDRIIHCDFPDLETFMKILLDHNAVAREDLLGVAVRLNKFGVANMLMDEIPTAADVQSARRCFKSGQAARQKGDKQEVSRLFELSLKREGSTLAEKQETLEILCELYFVQKDFLRCLETGWKLKTICNDDEESQIKQATLWENRGNELYKENEFDLMAKYCSLAMEFTPPSNKDAMSALLSNRCLALTSSKKLKEALADAKDCIALKPQWFQGYSLHGTCLSLLKRHEEALREFCKAYICARNEKERYAMAREVVSTAMEIPGNVIPMEAIKSPLNQLTLMAQMAIKNGDFPGALHFLSLGLAHLTEVASPFDSVPLLVQRAECFWQVGQFQASVLDMEQAIRAGLPRKFNNSQVILLVLNYNSKENM
ncbi:uncharacterized protein LOC114955374 [Acropora millepora]|uniref:uncharacterized protein LOC114955374 n=1 Tax=Acropora millepora TaxID=45264 RepID=UPI001CF1C95B|nr:uncharacterized protein LOC114955374 [Acropora millepora]